MNKQYLMLNLESDTFKGMKADFDELLQQLLEKLFAGRIADGSISMKLSVSLTETYSETMGKDISVPLFKHKTTANYTEKLENAGAVSLPNTYLEYDEDLGEFVLKPCGGEQECSQSRRLMKQLSTLKLFRRIATVPCSCVIRCAMTALIAIPVPATIAMAATSGSRR